MKFRFFCVRNKHASPMCNSIECGPPHSTHFYVLLHCLFVVWLINTLHNLLSSKKFNSLIWIHDFKWSAFPNDVSLTFTEVTFSRWRFSRFFIFLFFTYFFLLPFFSFTCVEYILWLAFLCWSFWLFWLPFPWPCARLWWIFCCVAVYDSFRQFNRLLSRSSIVKLLIKFLRLRVFSKIFISCCGFLLGTIRLLRRLSLFAKRLSVKLLLLFVFFCLISRKKIQLIVFVFSRVVKMDTFIL